MTDSPGADVSDGATGAAACSGCGRTPRVDEPVTAAGVPWTWSTAQDADRMTLLCDGCAREHARSIEAKLDAEWW